MAYIMILLSYSGRRWHAAMGDSERGRESEREYQKILYIMSINYLAGPETGDRRTRQINYTPLGSA